MRFRIALLAWAVAVWAAAAGAGGGAFRLLAPGAPAPAVELAGLDGQMHRVGGLRGSPQLLFFWSVFCPNCKEALPELVALYGRWKEQGLRVWAVSVDGERFSNAVRAYVRDMELPFPVVYDRLEGEDLVAADPYGVTKTPTLYVVSPEGRVALCQTVRVDFRTVEQTLRALTGP